MLPPSLSSLPAPVVGPLTGLRFSVVGPGRVGLSLAHWLVAAGGEVVSAAGRSDAGELISDGQALLLIAVPDPALPEVAARLADKPQAAVALHTSGSRDAGVLAPLRAVGCHVGALHPLKAFPHPLVAAAEARGVFFGLDGDAVALGLAARLVAAWGGIAGLVPADARPLYHFAATLAAGGVATLLAAAGELAGRVGLPAAVERGYLELARGTLAQIAAGAAGAAGAERVESIAGAKIVAGAESAAGVESAGTVGGPGPGMRRAGGSAGAAITGPVARGDLATFERHVAALEAVAPERLGLAIELARETLRQTPRENPGAEGRRKISAWIEDRERQGSMERSERSERWER